MKRRESLQAYWYWKQKGGVASATGSFEKPGGQLNARGTFSYQNEVDLFTTTFLIPLMICHLHTQHEARLPASSASIAAPSPLTFWISHTAPRGLFRWFLELSHHDVWLDGRPDVLLLFFGVLIGPKRKQYEILAYSMPALIRTILAV